MQDRYVNCQLIVETSFLAPDTDHLTIARDYGLDLIDSDRIRRLNSRTSLFGIADGRSISTVIAALSDDPLVLSAQPNYVFALQQSKERRPRSSKTASATQYALRKLNIDDAHEIATGKGVRIAVIDSAVDVAHPELEDAVSAEFDAIGFDAQRPAAHGTAIAGIIAARRRLTGIAPRSRLLAVRAFARHRGRRDDESTSFVLLRSLDWSSGKGARVYNMSFAGPRDPLMLRLLAEIHARGGILIAAVGNDGPLSPPLYPAAAQTVIGVTALDAKDRLYEPANRGDYVEVAAPGVDILVSSPNNRFAMSSGTSYAAAHISGLVGLLLESRYTLHAPKARRIISSSAVDLGAEGRDDRFGAGLVDALAALRRLDGAKTAIRR